MFKNINGSFLLGSLFHERNYLLPEDQRKPEYVRFSLHNDFPGLINARKTFVELEDPTGYLWAQRYLDGNYEHWVRLMEAKWFLEAYKTWMTELNARLKHKAFKKIVELAEGDETPAAVRLQAAKYLHSLDKATHGRGRPTSEEVSGEVKRLAGEARDIKDDLERIGLKVV